MTDTKLSNFPSDKEKRIALKIQLNFRQKVIGVKCGKIFFTLSSGGKMKPISETRDNLVQVTNGIQMWNQKMLILTSPNLVLFPTLVLGNKKVFSKRI